MNLTFKGFLRGYVRRLTAVESDSLRKLFEATVNDAPSAAEALMTFAASQRKEAYLAELAKGTWLEDNYTFASNKISESTLEAFLTAEDTPERYRKVLNAYKSKKESASRDRRVILLMRDKTLKALNAKGVSVAQVQKDLGLNKGNFYAYMNKGDASKISRDTARMVMNYVLNEGEFKPSFAQNKQLKPKTSKAFNLCKREYAQAPSVDELSSLTAEEASFRVAIHDFFMQQEQAKLVSEGVY